MAAAVAARDEPRAETPALTASARACSDEDMIIGCIDNERRAVGVKLTSAMAARSSALGPASDDDEPAVAEGAAPASGEHSVWSSRTRGGCGQEGAIVGTIDCAGRPPAVMSAAPTRQRIAVRAAREAGRR